MTTEAFFEFPNYWNLHFQIWRFHFITSKYIQMIIWVFALVLAKMARFFFCNIVKLYLLDMHYFHWACPALNGYNVWTTGGCDNKDELGIHTDNDTAETCQALCDADATCVSFELKKTEDDRECRLSTSCYYEDTNQSSSSNWCFYEKSNNFQESNKVIKKYFIVVFVFDHPNTKSCDTYR